MSTWLKLLPLELDGITNFIEPDHPLTEGDQEVGEMSDMSRQLFTLGRLLEKDARQLRLDAHYCNDEVKKLELEGKCAELMDKSNVVRELMWIGIKDDFGLWRDSIGVRVGYKVVTRPDTSNDVPPIIRLLGGQL